VLSLVNHIRGAGINFLAIDFDQTFINEHTNGEWRGTGYDLAQKVRPFFKQLMEAAHQIGLSMAIVSFSKQTSVIQQVLNNTFPSFSKDVPIRGGDDKWMYQGLGSQLGKQKHMASAAEEINAKSSSLVSIKRATRTETGSYYLPTYHTSTTTDTQNYCHSLTHAYTQRIHTYFHM